MNSAAIFIDYENIHYYLSTEFSNPPEIAGYCFEIIRSLKNNYEENNNLSAIIMNAYADFERIGSGAMSNLYLMGILTKNVLGTEHKNAADMQMCIDILETMYIRTDINNFMIVAGDRDYIPVIQYLKRQGKNINVAAFRKSVSGDLLEISGSENFTELEPLISEESKILLNKHKDEVFCKPVEKGAVKNIQLKVKGKIQIDEKAEKKSEIKLPKIVQNEVNELKPTKNLHHKFLNLILGYIEETGYQTPGMVPLLRYITDFTQELPNWERKHIIETLKQQGVINIVQSDIGYEYPVSVVEINYSHNMLSEI